MEAVARGGRRIVDSGWSFLLLGQLVEDERDLLGQL